ncbi:MAG: hypothetical protein RLZZ156_672 [Deinococcota bacterium]|jgi:Ca-activated chloride channel family protein
MKASSLTYGIIGAIACVIGAILFEVLFPARTNNAPENNKVAVALLIDTSGSMEQDGKLEEVKRAASDYVARQNLETNTALEGMSINRFSSDASTVSLFSKDTRRHLNTIGQFVANGATEMASGLETAAQSLGAAELGTSRVILLFTDGQPGSNIEPAEVAKPRTLTTANSLRASGYRIVAVGTVDADIGFLQTLTGDPSLVFPTSSGNFAAAFSKADAKIRNLFSSGAGGNRNFADALILGALVTLFLGGALLIAENTLGLRGRWWRDLLWVIPASALLGIGGALLGQVLFAIFGDGARVIGWAVVGTIAGGVLGLADKSPAKAVRGAIGGTVGGVVGGLVFSLLGGAFSSGVLELLGRLLGFAALGFAVGLMLQLVQQALKTAWLTGITTGAYEGKQYILGKPVVTVGRSDGNDIGLYREKNLALNLGTFNFNAGRWMYNGEAVLVNGNSLSSAALVNGDTIKFGATEFLFETKDGGGAPRAEEEIPEPQVTPTPEPRVTPTIPEARVIPIPKALEYWKLRGAETLELPFGTVTLGRSEENQIVIPEASISGQHAQLEVRSESLSITDLGSTNGTFVNGRQLAENETAQLTEGMSLTLGAVEFRVSR